MSSFILAAGGTGGHMIPAHALAAELKLRGHKVALITDPRGSRIPGLFEGIETHVLPAGRLGAGRFMGGPLSWIRAVRGVMQGRAKAVELYGRFRPAAVVGFGGYPAFPALLAASSRRVPTILHEQNAVLGRVNRLLAGRATAIATAYETVRGIKPGQTAKVQLVGNPVRAEVRALASLPFPPIDENGVFRILVTGGSQGATILSAVVPDGLGMLPPSLRQRLQVTQQCRAEDIEQVRARYAALGIPADLATYLPDMPDKLAWSHLVIARAGASTIAELTAAGRPAILIPLPSATDDHQTANAREMAAGGGARVIPQAKFTPVELAKQMQKLGLEPEALTFAATKARLVGRPNATRDLADLVERVANGQPLAPAEIGVAGAPARSEGAFA